ncbi:MAG TPA: hypothetical protein HPP77_05665 [Candidatus Hydrogenedentes bacterium]|nr:hypothetical protein [Candidatus Hydrogenedentota bacterium]HIJ73472.1 hypothetical protein [Candidatus Hydrogenedentota bacterium]
MTLDAHKGIAAALEHESHGVAWQRYRAHFMREAAGILAKSQRAGG